MALRAMNSALPPSRMSVPRPAMLVAIVTAPFLPAWATISASFSWNFAFSTTCSTPRRASMPLKSSLFSTLTVPTSTGWPVAWRLTTSSMMAAYFAFIVTNTASFMSSRIMGRLVGMVTTSSL